MNPGRIALAISHAISHLQGFAAYGTIVGILLICGLGVPIPEDITLLCAGLLAWNESITLPGALISGFIGVVFGDAFLFFMGRRYGKKVFQLPGLRRILTAERVAAAERRIRQNGPFICFIARFLPGLRSPVFAMAGALGVKRRVFFLLDGFAALLSVPLWVYFGYWFGSNLEEAIKKVEHVQKYVLSGLSGLIVMYLIVRILQRRRRERRAQAASATQLPQL
jgi:membrane protein DedA with SNARE-associated domain